MKIAYFLVERTQRMKEEVSLSFYTSNSIYLMLLLQSLFVIAGGLIAFYGWKNDTGLAVLGVVLASIFILQMYPVVKRIWTRTPYLIITNTSLIINQSYKGPVSIDAADINGFELLTLQMKKHIFIILDNTEKYREIIAEKSFFKKRPRNVMGISPLYIVWHQVRKKDRSLLVSELERLIDHHDFLFLDNLSEQVESESVEQEIYEKKDKVYFLQAYAYSLALSILAVFIMALDGGDISIAYLILSFLLFPFGKVMFDDLIGLKINFLRKKETMAFMDYYFFPLTVMIYGFIYMVSTVIAPLGIIYFLVSTKLTKKE